MDLSDFQASDSFRIERAIARKPTLLACNKYCGWTESCTTWKPWEIITFVGIYRGIIIPGSLRWCRISFIHSRSPSDRCPSLPFFRWEGFPHLKWTAERSWYPYSKPSTGGPIQGPTRKTPERQSWGDDCQPKLMKLVSFPGFTSGC